MCHECIHLYETIMTKAPWSFMTKSPIDIVHFRGQKIHVKRDDMFHLEGNKLRKLYWFLCQKDSYFENTHLYSYGGTQSNAMLAIAQLANHKGVPLTYFSREINLRDSNVLGGNLQTALALGMRHVQLQTEIYQELTKTKNIIQTLGSTKCHVTRLLKSAIQSDKENNVFIPQGASFPEAELGVQTLAQEINQYCDVQKPTKFTVVLPCGTGTTAFYLAKHLNPDIRLYGVPCVGDAKYLEEQIQELATKPSFISNKILPRFPSILIPRTKSKFGRLSIPLYDLFHELKTETNIEFDLIYASFTWQTLLDQLDLLRFDDTCSPQGLLGSNTNRVLPREIIYVHTGGVSGNSTMLERYITKLRNKSFHIAPINCGPHHKDHGDI